MSAIQAWESFSKSSDIIEPSKIFREIRVLECLQRDNLNKIINHFILFGSTTEDGSERQQKFEEIFG